MSKRGSTERELMQKGSFKIWKMSIYNPITFIRLIKMSRSEDDELMINVIKLKLLKY